MQHATLRTSVQVYEAEQAYTRQPIVTGFLSNRHQNLGGYSQDTHGVYSSWDGVRLISSSVRETFSHTNDETRFVGEVPKERRL